MATQLPDIVSKVRIDTSGMKKGVDEAGKAGQAMGSRMKDGIKKYGPAIAAAGAAAGLAFAKGAVSAASSVGESLSKVDVVFGDAADKVVEFSKTSAKALGQSQAQALEAAGTYGNLLVAMDVNVDKAAEMSTGFTTLASDLASFNDVDPAEALDALRSALSGETEPLKRFGVNLNAARIEAEALKLGLAATKDELDAGAKAQAAYSLIMKDTATAQGDFARTSDSLANQQRTLSATFSDIQANLGQALLPTMEMAAKVANAFAGVIAKTPTPVIALGTALTGVVGALIVYEKAMTALRSITILSTVATNAKKAATASSAAVTRAAAATELGLSRALTFVRTNVVTTTAAMAARKTADLASAAASKTLAGAQLLVSKSTGAVRAAVTAVTSVNYKAIASTVAHRAAMIAAAAAAKAMAAAQWLLNAAMAANPITLVVIAIAALVAIFVVAWKKSETFRRVVTAAFEAIQKAGGIMVDAIAGFFRGMFEWLVKADETLRAIPARIMRFFADLVKKAVDAGKNLISGFIEGIKDKAGDLIQAVKDFITDPLPGFVKDALGIESPSKVFKEFGRNISVGLAEGIADGAGAAASAAQGLSSAVQKKFSPPGLSALSGAASGAAFAGGGYGPAGGVVYDQRQTHVHMNSSVVQPSDADALRHELRRQVYLGTL